MNRYNPYSKVGKVGSGRSDGFFFILMAAAWNLSLVA